MLRPKGEERTVRVARRRFARRQWARRWLAWRRVVAMVLGLAVVAGLVWLVFFSSVLAIRGVDVAGEEVLQAEEVRRAAGVPIGEPLATADLDAITSRIEALAPVQSVVVSRAWPDAVRIAVQERNAVAVLERDGTLRGVDESGVDFRSYRVAPKRLPVISMGSDAGPDALAEAATVVGALPQQLAARVDSVQVETIDTISLALTSGRTIIWGSADDSANKARVLAVLLKQKATTYDVSVPAQPTLRR